MKTKLFKNNKVPQALIVRQAPLSNFNIFLNIYLKFLICPEHGCNKCEWCKKIDNNQYYDLIALDAKDGVKKEQILEITNRFSRTGLENANIRVYVIKNIEYASAKVLNSLLKFVEEPPVGVYAVFTTRNYNAVLPTIRSRCFNYFIEADEKSVDSFLNTTQLKPFDKKLIKSCFYELDEMKSQYEIFIKYYGLIKNLHSKSYLSFATEGLNLFRKMTYEEINLFLEISKNLYPAIAQEIIAIQDKLYLNTNKSLIFSMVYDLLTGAK